MSSSIDESENFLVEEFLSPCNEEKTSNKSTEIISPILTNKKIVGEISYIGFQADHNESVHGDRIEEASRVKNKGIEIEKYQIENTEIGRDVEMNGQNQTISNLRKNGKNKKVGKRMKCPLRKFFDTQVSKKKKPKNSNSNQVKAAKTPKIENFRLKLLRGHRKSIGIILKNGAVEILYNYTADTTKFAELAQFIHSNKSALLLSEKNLPLTEAQPKRKKTYGKNFKQLLGGHKTFSNSYCKKVFADKTKKEGFVKYIECVFSNSSQKLCEFFMFNCCPDQNHSGSCEELWKSLEIYSINHLLKI